MTDELEKLKRQVESFLNTTLEARNQSELARDYYDGKQWSNEQVAILKRRNQAPVVINRVKPKVEGLKGLLEIRKTDIKAYPRNKDQDEGAAFAITDALRFISDNNDFDTLKADCFEDKVVEGYCACIVEVEEKKGSFEITINRIHWDRFYFDPYSRQRDFTDAKFLGQVMWLDEEEVLELFPDANLDELAQESDTSLDNTFEDKIEWFIKDVHRRRFRVVQHFYLEKGVWRVAIFSGTSFLLKPQDSPYLNEDGEPACPIIADSAYIDRLNNRYGEVKGFLSQQDEINHRRSKALHLLSTRQTIAKNGAIPDVGKLKRELAKPDGHVTYNGDVQDFQVLNTGDMSIGQFQVYQDAKAELDAVSFNAQLSGERQSGDLSGVAIDKLQSAGSMEINSLYTGFANWEKRVFRQVWASVKQYWDSEKWIRITDDQDNLKWVGLNTQITLQEMLEDIINDDSKPENMRIGASATFQTMMQSQDPRLQTIVEIKNFTPELDADIILDQSFDVINIQKEQFDTIAQFAQSSKDIDIIELIELSQLKNKDELIEKIEKRRQAQAQALGGQQQMQTQEAQTKNAKMFADAQLTTKKAEQTAIENQILLINGDNNPQVNI